jgi:hypothetical protein
MGVKQTILLVISYLLEDCYAVISALVRALFSFQNGSTHFECSLRLMLLNVAALSIPKLWVLYTFIRVMIQ